MRKKIIIVSIMIFFIYILLTSKSLATESCKIEINTNTNYVAKGENIECIIAVSNIKTNIQGITFSIEYDKSKLELDSDVEGLNNWIKNKYENTYILYAPNYESISTNSTICKLSFKVKEDSEVGNTDIHFKDIELIKDEYSVEYDSDEYVTCNIAGEIMIGDLNDNGQLDSGDIIKIYRHIAQSNNVETATRHPEWKLSDEKITQGDLNKNGRVDMGDVIKIQRYMAANNNPEVAQKHPDWLNVQ